MAAVFNPIGARQHSGYRQPNDRICGFIAGKGRNIDGFTGAVGTPIGGQENIDMFSGLAPLDTPIGQIKFRIGQGQECNILIGLFGNNQRRLRATGAPRQSIVKPHITTTIGF